MRGFTFSVGGGCRNAPVDFGPCRAGTSTVIEVLFSSTLSVSVNVSISNLPRHIDAVPKQFVLNPSSKMNVKFTWVSKDTKFQILNETLNVESQKSVQHLVLLGLATEKELNIFFSASNEKLYFRILGRPETFFVQSPIFKDTAGSEAFISRTGLAQRGTDPFVLLSDRTIYDKVLHHGSSILNNFTNSLLHTSYLAGYEVFQAAFLRETLPNILMTAHRRYSQAIPAIRRKVTFRGDISAPLDQQCRSMLSLALESIDGAIFRLVCDCLYRPQPNLFALFDLPQVRIADILLKLQQSEIVRQLFCRGSAGLQNRALNTEDQRMNKARNCNLFIVVLCFIDLSFIIYKASGILRPLQHHVETVAATGKRTSIAQARTLTEFLNSYYTIIGSTGGLSTILNDLGFGWFNQSAEQSHPISSISSPLKNENIANFRTLLPHLLLYMSRKREYCLDALKIPAETYEEIIANMRILISFCWPHTLVLEASKGLNKNLASLPSLTKTMLNKIILTIIKENQMAGLLCSEKVFLACLNSTVETSMISISCQQIFKRLKYVFNPSNSPVVRTVDRMYNEFRRKQEALTRSSVMLSNANVLDTIMSGSKAHLSATGNKHRTLLVTLERHLNSHRYSEFLLLALQMIALVHGYDLNGVIFDPRDCVNNGLLLIMIARVILPTGKRIFPGKTLWKFNFASTLQSSMVLSTYSESECYNNDDISEPEDGFSCSLRKSSTADPSGVDDTRGSRLERFGSARAATSSEKEPTLSQIIMQQQERDGYVKPEHDVLRLADFYSCHLAFVSALERYEELLQKWDYSLSLEVFVNRHSILRVLPSFVYSDNVRERTRYSFSLFRLIDAYTRSMGSTLPNTSMLSYYVSILFVTALVSNDYCLTGDIKLELLHISPEERDYQSLLNKYAKKTEQYRVRTRVDRRIAAIQASCRGFLARQYYRRVRYSALVIQHMWRTKLYHLEKGYLLTAQARRNLYLRALLTHESRPQDNIFNTEPGKRVLKAVLSIQRYAKQRALRRLMPTVQIYLATKRRTLASHTTIQAIRVLQYHMLMCSLLSFFKLLADAERIFKFSWSDVKLFLPTALRGSLSLAESCDLLESQLMGTTASPGMNRFTNLGFSTQYLHIGPYLSISRSKAQLKEYIARITSVGTVFRASYAGYIVRRTLALMLSRASSYPHPSINHKQSIFYGARWMQYHPADVLQVLLSRQYSVENREYVLSAYIAEYHGLLSSVLLIQAHFRGTKERLRVRVLQAIIWQMIGAASLQNATDSFYTLVLREATRSVGLLEAEARKKLGKCLTMDQYVQMITLLMDTVLARVSKIQAAFRGCKLRTTLYRIRCACCNDFILMRFAVSNGFNYYVLVDAEMIILRCMRRYRQGVLVARAIQAAPSAIKLFIDEASLRGIQTIADFNTYQDKIVHAATLLQSVVRMLITTRNLNCVMTVSPILLRYPIICDGLLLPTVIFREIMLKHVIDNTVRLQSCARGYRVRLRQQLLHILVEKMLGITRSTSSHPDTASRVEQIVARQLDLVTCSPKDICEYADSVSKSVVVLQAHIRGWSVRRNYMDCILVSVRIIQRAIKNYLHNLFTKLMRKYSTLLNDLPLLVSIGLVSRGANAGICRDVPYLSAGSLATLQDTCERLSYALASFRGAVVRLRLRRLRDLSATQHIFSVLWHQASIHDHLPPSVTSALKIYGFLNNKSIVLQTYMRRRLVHLRLELIQHLTNELVGLELQSQSSVGSFMKQTVLCIALQAGLTDAAILDAFVMTTESVTLIQRTIRRRIFIRNIGLLKVMHLTLSNLSPLSFYMVLQFFKNVAADRLPWTIRSKKRSVAILYVINKSLERVQACALSYLALQMQHTYNRLELDPMLYDLLRGPNVRSSSALQRIYEELDRSTRMIQAWIQGRRVRQLVSLCWATLLARCSYADSRLQRILLHHLLRSENQVESVEPVVLALMSATSCIQRHYRGWRVRCALNRIAPSLAHLMLTRGFLKTADTCASFYNNVLKAIQIIQLYARLFLRAQSSIHLDQVNMLLQNDGSVDIMNYLSSKDAPLRISSEDLWRRAHSLKESLTYLQAFIRCFLVRKSVLAFRSLCIYFGLSKVCPSLLLELAKNASSILFSDTCVLYHPSRIEPSLKWIKISGDIILHQFALHQKGATIRLLGSFPLPARCYIHRFIDTTNPRLILKPDKCAGMTAQLVHSAIVIQSVYRGYITRKMVTRVVVFCEGDSILAQTLLNNIFIAASKLSSDTSLKVRSTALLSSSVNTAERMLSSAALVIQRTVRLRMRNKRISLSQFYGAEHFSSEDLKSRDTFRRRELALLRGAITIQSHYRKCSISAHLARYTKKDTHLASIFLRNLQQKQPLDGFSSRLAYKQCLLNMQLVDAFLNSAVITIQKVCRGYTVHKIYLTLHQYQDIGLYPWMILNLLSTDASKKLTYSCITDIIRVVCAYITCIQAYIRGYIHRAFSVTVAAEYNLFLTRQEKLSGPAVIIRVCRALDAAEGLISAYAKSYLIRTRFNCLRRYSAVPPPDQINSILTIQTKFQSYLLVVMAVLAIQCYSRGFLTVCSLRQAVPRGMQLYLPQALMTAPSKCALLTDIIIDLIVHIQTSTRKYLASKSMGYITKHLDKRSFNLFFTSSDLRLPSVVLDKIQLILSSASLIAIRGRAFITRKTYLYVQLSGLLKFLPATFTYSHYSHAVEHIKDLLHCIVLIQAGARGFFVRHKIRTIKEMTLEYGATLDPILLQLIWERTVPNHFNSVTTYSDSYYERLDTGVSNNALSVFDAAALIAHSAILIQKYFRGYAAYTTAFLCKKFCMHFTWNVGEGFGGGVVVIQSAIRGWNTRAIFANMDTWERNLFLSKGAHLHLHCPSQLDVFRAEINKAALILGRTCRGFIIRLESRAFKHALGKIRHKPTRRAFKSTLESLSIHLNIKAATQEATRFSAALHIQAHYRGNKDRASIPQRLWRKIQHIRERLTNSLVHGDKTKTVAKQILIHKAILFKAEHPHNNPRSVTKLNYFCNLYSPSAGYIFSRDFCDIIIDVIGATITTPVLQQYNVFRDGCCLITKMLTYNPLTCRFNTLNLTNFQELVKVSSPKMQHASAKTLNPYAPIPTVIKPLLMRLPDTLINAIDFNREDREICKDAEELLCAIMRCAEQIGYDRSYFISEFEKLEELHEAGLLKDLLGLCSLRICDA
ncbi:Hypothetical protein GLP15_4282 [Giardia lamblia P15]|uniref:IQ calmodulin-binding motif-containing protein n=1 Tax=Giardia intestinalis (strain P15) TaxID=658858 RepID=E1EVN0_GIAIA|nr:Hypothetical protein GLP15_4282 [Giardia lamblia P15]